MSIFIIANDPYTSVSDAVEQKQLPINDESKQRLITIRTNIFNDETASLAEKMFTGDMTLGAWEEAMKKLVRELHSSVAAIGKGGWDKMTWEDWGRLGPVLKDQYTYLHAFAQKIAENRETISLRAIQAQAKLYGSSAKQSVDKVIALPIEKRLPWMPRVSNGNIGMDNGDGTECRMNCCCGWVLKITGREGAFNIVEATWVLGAVEHCDTCVKRNGYVAVMRLHETIEVPERIGFYCYEKELKEHEHSAMICLDCSKVHKLTELAASMPEPAKDLHITLLYYPSLVGLDIDGIKDALTAFAEISAPIAGRFSGYAIFEATQENDNLHPLVALYDSPQLPFVRVRLENSTNFHDVNHGLTPHCTLAYIDRPQQLPFEAFDYTFDSISLWVGDGEHYDFPITGNVVEKGGKGSGNFNHAGRPGKVGGSTADSNLLVDNIKDLHTDEYHNSKSIGYFVTANNKLLDTAAKPGIIGEAMHSEAARAHPELLGVRHSDVENRLVMMDNIMSKGNIRIRYTNYSGRNAYGIKSSLIVHTHSADSATLKRLHKLYDTDKLPMADIVNWITTDCVGKFSWVEFINAKGVGLIELGDNLGYEILLKELLSL